MLTIQTLTLLGAAVVNIFLLVIVASDNWKKNKTFIALASSVILWIAGTLVFMTAQTQTLAQVGIQFFYIAPMYAITFLALFSTQFASTSKTRVLDVYNSILIAFTFIFSILIAVLPNFLTSSIELTTQGYNSLTVDTVAYTLYTLFFNVAFTLTFIRLLLRVKHSKGIQRKQFIYILIGTGLTASISLVTNLTLPSLGDSSLIWIGPSASIFYVIAVAVAIIRHGLFDIRLTAIRTAAYVLSLATLAGIYYVIVYLVSVTIFQEQTTTSVSVSPANIFIALILAFLFQPIKLFFDRVTNAFFYRDRYDSNKFYLRLNEILTATTSLEEVLKGASHEISTTLKSDQAFFVIAHSRDDYMQVGTSQHRRLPLKDIHDINSFVEAHGEGIILASQMVDSSRHLTRILLSHRIELMMPLVRHGAIVGYCLLGEQLTNGYKKRDLRVLETISDELVIAIQHAMSVEQVKNINESLEQRIEAATAELRTSNARLKRLDTSKDEFLSMASHQLRTPLTSIKGYISMMLEGDVGKVSPMQKKVLEEAFTSSERMVHLIHDFLNVSRLQTGKFMLELQEIDLAALVSAEVKSLNRAAQSRNMTLKFINEAGSVPMTLDDTKIRQVVMNYIDNAIYYSHTDTTITIELTKTKKEIILKVKDTGIGVPPNEQDQLFGKFFRATNARKQRPDGTGVGLYLAKKVITALGGDIVFESKLGRGSTFGFRLPLDQDPEKLQDNTKQLVDEPSK